MKEFNLENILEVVHYDAETGKFAWKANRQKALIGKEICEISDQGYVYIRVLGRRILAHRLAWFVVHGELPSSPLDHFNGDRTDNRIANLRLCTNSQNLQNRGKQANNTSGYMGVSWHKVRSKWRATIQIDKKHMHLGLFDTAEDAYAAYCYAKSEMHDFSAVPLG